MNKQLRNVRDFMIACDQTTRFQPTADVPIKERILRLRLIQEELNELMDAMCLPMDGDRTTSPANLVQVLDALTDLTYVVNGTYYTFGLAHLAEAAFAEVHASNMTKRDAGGRVQKDEFGKVIKPKTYKPAKLEIILARDTQQASLNVFK